MPRHSRLSVLLVRAPTLRLTTVFTELPALSRTERRRLAEATRAAAAAYKESSDEEVRGAVEWMWLSSAGLAPGVLPVRQSHIASPNCHSRDPPPLRHMQNIWEDEGAEEQSAEDGACSAAGAEQPQPEQVEEELEPVCDAAAAASVEEGQAGKGDEGAEGDEEAAGAGDECDEEGADGCGDENMAPAPAPAEETEEGSSNTGVAVIDDDTAGAVDAPAPALGGGQDLARVKVLLQQLLLLGAESEAAVADVHDTAACTLDAVAELRQVGAGHYVTCRKRCVLRPAAAAAPGPKQAPLEHFFLGLACLLQEMGERFMALERTLFAVCHHLDITGELKWGEYMLL